MFIVQSSWKAIVGLSVAVTALLLIGTVLINHAGGATRAVSPAALAEISPHDLMSRHTGTLVAEAWPAH